LPPRSARARSRFFSTRISGAGRLHRNPRARCTTPEAVLNACLAELGDRVAPAEKGEDVFVSSADVAATVRRLELSRARRRIGFFTRCAEAVFIVGVAAYALLFPPSALFEGSWTDALTDGSGVFCLAAGALVRIWAVSHIGPWTGSGRLDAPTWPLSGPYAFVRYPVPAGNFLIGLGMILVLDAFPFIALLLIFLALHHRLALPAEETFLEARFGADFTNYRDSVPAYVPEVLPRLSAVSWGHHFTLKELGAMCAMTTGLFVLEWLKSSPHREWFGHLLQLLSR
jgi:protein-S-isoprenylcysteine O-methyltransferase Ste14